LVKVYWTERALKDLERPFSRGSLKGLGPFRNYSSPSPYKGEGD